MNERRSSIHSDTKDDDDDDDQLLGLTTESERQHERMILNTIDEPTIGINATHTKELSDTEPLLDEIRVEPPTGGTFMCSDAPARYVVAIWAFFGFFCLYAMRVNLSVAIVAMVTPQSALNQSAQSCPTPIKNSTGPPQKYEFDWNPTVEGAILGAFFYGYLAMQIIGGNLAEKVGAKWIFGGGILIAGILTLLTPLAARTDYRLLFAIRFITGVVSSPGFPSAAALWGKWIPASERSTIPPASQTGANFGIILSTPLISYMIEDNFLGGWPSAFYVFGVISCLWFVGWCFFGFNSPDQHPRISKKELLYIQKNTATTRKRIKTPWVKIFTCPPVYAIAVMHNGLIFALPYFAQFLVTIIVGTIVDRIRARKLLSITVLRKGQTIIGTVGTCSFLIAIGYMGCNHIGAVICCILAVAFLGTLVGFTNTVATIPGFIGPLVVGALTNKNQTIEAWRHIFNIAAGIGAFGCLFYCIFFNGEEQPWNRTYESIDEDETTTTNA
ncbi:unnamed protein product [Adineta steineri]|uniref:Major facilitator superfamily (MFS) profile domain-containing protein n=2 Tax=Adineta steineri TaxID=433720 RepID=A0A813NT79_9BILA|nr:unnamed protein product [Adineta steineri]CAF0754655.1 unnamed protein product [Adineta steineri]